MNLDFELLEVVLVLETAMSAASVMIPIKLKKADFIEASWIGFGSVQWKMENARSKLSNRLFQIST